jgi:flagellar hook-length control protein FliK
VNTVITAVPTDPAEALAPAALVPASGRVSTGDFDLLIALLQASLASPSGLAPGPAAPGPAVPGPAAAGPSAAGTAVPASLAGATAAVTTGVATAPDGSPSDATTLDTPSPLLGTPVLARRVSRGVSPDEAASLGNGAVEGRDPLLEDEPAAMLTAPASLLLPLMSAPTAGLSTPSAPEAESAEADVAAASVARPRELAPAVAPLLTPAASDATAGPQTAGAPAQAPRPVADEAAPRALALDAVAVPEAKPTTLVSADVTASAELLGEAETATAGEPRPRAIPAARGAEAIRIAQGSASPESAADAMAQRFGATMSSRAPRLDSGRDELPGLAARPSRDDGAAVAPASESTFSGASATAPVLTGRSTLEDAEPARAEPLRDPVDQIATRLREVRTPGRHEISVRLDPPELGAVRIDARLEGARLHLQIRAEHAPTGDLLADALPRLRDSLVQQGFVPADVSVHLGLDGSGRHSARDGAPTFAPPRDGEPSPQPRTVPAAATRAVVASDGLDVWA